MVRQHDRSDCGAAALLSVLRHWGGDSELGRVRELAATGDRGSTLLGLHDAARRLGFAARGLRGSYEDLSHEPLPVIAHLVLESGRTHFVVVFRVDRKGVEVMDPALGHRRMSRAEFEASWRSRSVLRLTPTQELADQRSRGWVRWLGGHMWDERLWLGQSLFLGVVVTAVSLITAVFMQWLVDRFIPEGNVALITATGIFLGVLLVLRAIAGYVRERFLIRLNRRVSQAVHGEFLEHLYRLPLRFFSGRTKGDVTTRLSDGVKVQRGLVFMIGTLVIDGLLVTGSFALLVILAPQLAALAGFVLPIQGWLLLRGSVRIGVRQREAVEGYARLESAYIDGLTGIRAVLDHAVGGWFSGSAGRLHDRFQGRVEGVGRVRAGLAALSELGGGILVTASLVGGALLVVSGTLQLGELMAGYSLLSGMIPSVERLVQSGMTFQETGVAASRLRDVLVAPHESTGRAELPPLRRGLALENVSLTWPGGDSVFDGLTLELPIGRVTGLTGRNGVGKTTLARLLNGTVRPDAGRVLADGVSITRFAPGGYRRRVALVPAEVHVFTGSLGFNVLLDRQLGTGRSALQRVESLGFGPFLERFAEGWDTPVGEGGRRLSSGERQAVGLARAVVCDPDVTLVDEGVTSTDDELSRLLLEILVRHSWRGAVLLISHDRHVLSYTEHLLVLDDGRIVDRGDPESVLVRRRRHLAPPRRQADPVGLVHLRSTPLSSGGLALRTPLAEPPFNSNPRPERLR